MNKSQAIELLNSEGWTKADAQRALGLIDFKVNPNPDEIIIRQAASKFAGTELIKRQRLQAAQKRLVTQKSNLIKDYISEIKKYQDKFKTKSNSGLEIQVQKLTQENQQLTKVNSDLKKDNKDLKNIVDRIKLGLTIEIKHLMRYEDSEIRKGLIKLLHSTLG